MATLQNIGKLKYRGKDGQWHPLPVVVQGAGGGVSTISGKGQPTESTVGRLNQLYRDESTDKLYICTEVSDGGYTWAAVSGSGGTVDVDATLTKAGYAADAKAAGDAILKKLDATALPTAINDALAQAKASGEFDGPKGDKGDKGAPGAQGIRGEKGETGPAGAKGDTGPVGSKGADGKDGAGMDVTGAKVGQIAKITAVDSAGKPTAWEPVDMPMPKTLKWITVYSTTLTEATNNIVVSADANGKPIADYNPVGLLLLIATPADATQGSNNGNPWVYPSATKSDNAIRVIGTIAGWKTIARDSVFAFMGNSSAVVCTGNGNTTLSSYKIDGYKLNGVKAYLNNANDHFPVGTRVDVNILSEIIS